MDDEMSEAWREAATRLQIRVVAPCEVDLPTGGTVVVEAFLPDFGGPNGTVVISASDEDRAKRAAAGGAYVSLLAAVYRCFGESLFRETLDDWGWFGG